ncbi:hypothetical protein [Vibrio fortis]
MQTCHVHPCRGDARAQTAGGTHYLQRAEPEGRLTVGYDEPPPN